jgi:aspartate/methionine/tyrosine aminotransferase
MAGGKVVYVPLTPPPAAKTTRSSSAGWTVDLVKLEKAISPRTKTLVRFEPK